MSRHLYGCRVIQRLIEQCDPEQLEVVYSNVLADCALLMKNAYGNYVIQHVLEHGKQEHRDRVMECVEGNLLPLSQHKFASNVVEKFLRVARADQTSLLVAELCRNTDLPDGTTAAPLHVMMKDKYANYVIQTLMQFAPQRTQTALLDYIHDNRDVLRCVSASLYVLALWVNFFFSLKFWFSHSNTHTHTHTHILSLSLSLSRDLSLSLS